MFCLRASVGLVVVSTLPLWGATEHNPLLPRPQKIAYGARNVPVRGLTIHLASGPSPEDLFAARELSSDLSRVTGTEIPVSEKTVSGRAITLSRIGPVDPLPVPGEGVGPDSREAYTLKVTPDGVEIEGRSSAGLYYGALTLRQLVEGNGAGAVLPEVEITDWPSLAYRGIMVDASHGPLPTEAEIKRQLDFLARWKGNQYYLYSEASIELKGYSILNPEARYDRVQVARIVAYARERHIDVVPCVELYGHLHDLFRVERYSGLAIFPHGNEFNPDNPQTAALLDDWIGQLAGMFPSRFFHIGLDETWETGAVATGDKEKPARLYMDQFQRVSGMVRKHGKTVMLWSDMFAKYPEFIPSIAPGTIIIPWGYDRQVYEPYWKPFEEGSLPVFIATGVSIWDQIAPNFDRSFDNIDHFLSLGRKHKMQGIINTLWTDTVAVLMRPAGPGIAYGAASAWQADPVDRRNFFTDYSRITYSSQVAAEVAPALVALDRSENEISKALGTEPKEWERTLPSFWDDPLTPSHLARAKANREGFRQTRLLAETAEEHLIRAKQLGGDDPTLSDFLLEARMLDYSGMKHVYAAEMADFWKELGPHPARSKLESYLSGEITSKDHSRLADLMDRAGDLREGFRAAWLDCYTPYRLGAILGKWDAEFQYWWRLNRKINDYLDAWRDGDTLAPLESFSPGY